MSLDIKESHRLQQRINELPMDPNEYDENGKVIGQREPMITVEQARKLMGWK